MHLFDQEYVPVEGKKIEDKLKVGYILSTTLSVARNDKVSFKKFVLERKVTTHYDTNMKSS